MTRFRVTRTATAVHIAFDDGGMNLLSSAALRELRAVIGAVGEATLVTFSSARPNLFAAGADMAEMRGFSGLEAEAFARMGQELFDEIERLPMLTAALIDGDCFGGALDLALAFDLRFATPRSRFAHPGSRIGIVTGFGGTSRWRKVLSRPAAHQLFLANRILPAEEAEAFGLVDGVAVDFGDELQRLSALDVTHVQLVKTLTRSAAVLSREDLHLLATRLGAVTGR
ncbi:MAG TPA: enoyl-CoA hydratase/isomerase family protein [Thermoanaerobaculia bacterium]|jgi:enoyl-CoA hydratase